MYSNIVPFTEVVDAIKDSTNITNLRNLYPQIRRLVYRAEKEIGYGGSLIMKRIVYRTSDGTIFVDSNNNYKAKLPEDLIKIEEVGTCFEGLCPKDYRHQGNYLFLCRAIEEFSLIYYSLMCDGEGNPIVTENHFEAVVAGVRFFMYQPKIWNGEGNMNVYKDLEIYYENRIGEAIGWDVFPTTKKEWSRISEMLRMSQRDMIIYSEKVGCYQCFPESENKTSITNDPLNDMVYFWQYEDLVSDISLAPSIDQAFLDQKNSVSIQEFINGYVITYDKVGRIAFAITNTQENYWQIIDVFETDITTLVFDTYYNADTKTQIYISKTHYSHGNIYYKLIVN